jgi:hypothetical protein
LFESAGAGIKILKKRLTIVVISLLAFALFAAAALYLYKVLMRPKPMHGVLLNYETNEETAYSLSILAFDEIENEFVKAWIERNKGTGEVDEKAVYYTVYGDNIIHAPLEMYLFMPNAREIMGDINLTDIKVRESGTAIVLNIETRKNIKRTKASTDLIFHVYVSGPPEQASAKTERLIINGEAYTNNGATFTRLR